MTEAIAFGCGGIVAASRATGMAPSVVGRGIADETLRRQLETNEPAISVDTKKRELVGPYKDDGRELSGKGDPVDVNVHDFVDDEKGRATPYGIYDLQKNEAWVSVGVSHHTRDFAVQSIRTWWSEMGASRYPNATSLLITADRGGSNGYRLRLWKLELQKLVYDLRFAITVCHLPPGRAIGTRSSVACFPSSPRTGAGSLWSPIKSLSI